MTKIEPYKPINPNFRLETFQRGKMWGARIIHKRTCKTIVSTEQMLNALCPTEQMAADLLIATVECGAADFTWFAREELKIGRG